MHSWTAHERGVRQLYRLRGPEQNPSPLARLLHEDFRYTTVIQGIQHRKSLYPQESHWSTGSRQDRGYKPELRLYDIGFAVVAMLECADKISEVEDAEEKFASRRQLLRLCQAIHERMEHWQERFLQEVPLPVYWAKDAVPDGLETRDYLSRPRSSSPPSQLQDIHKALDSSGPPFYTKYCSPSMLHVAGNIAQSVPYLMNPVMGTVASQRLLLPLSVARGTFQPQSGPELTWCNSALGRISTEKGIKYGQGIARAGQIWGVSEEQQKRGLSVDLVQQ
ncbi:hypothetical protein EDD36DRAFT_414063 [Exophiala viscosa]|uniref:Uncharacterized protein n=1 Tax=Exophiala viscosa TaxID=2486360 RepID=A0AAN6II69_9EURO|nr:hypothetical protein EDD36DRAFT_414063 [Exophiala viscosa]